ncbi:MAG: GntR family transcriptional regulator, partial [Spirochaetaceae bacterium JB067]
MAATITQESLSDKVYTIIKQQILSGELKGGTLLSEEAFAEQFGVSRTPIREALRRLNEYGLVKLKPHSQAVVHKVDEKEFADITRLRITLETLVVESLLKLRAKDYIGNLY